jgi:hypothetical protein
MQWTIWTSLTNQDVPLALVLSMPAFFKVFFKTLDGLPEDLADLTKATRSESKLLAHFE